MFFALGVRMGRLAVWWRLAAAAAVVVVAVLACCGGLPGVGGLVLPGVGVAEPEGLVLLLLGLHSVHSDVASGVLCSGVVGLVGVWTGVMLPAGVPVVVFPSCVLGLCGLVVVFTVWAAPVPVFGPPLAWVAPDCAGLTPGTGTGGFDEVSSGLLACFGSRSGAQAFQRISNKTSGAVNDSDAMCRIRD
jgi:hypothetical protein